MHATGSEVTYTVDVPHVLTSSPDELALGLVLVRDGKTVGLRQTRAKVRDIDRAQRITVHFEAEHTPGMLELSNGNLPDAAARFHTEVQLDRDVTLTAPAPDADPMRPSARRTKLALAPASTATRWERRIRRLPRWRPASDPPLTVWALPTLLAAMGLLPLLTVRRRTGSDQSS